MAMPSLSRDSPPMIMVSESGAPSCLRRATTATGSVADITAPKAMLKSQVQCPVLGMTYWTTMAKRAAPMATPGKASVAHWLTQFLRTLKSRFIASPKTRGGMKA